MCVRACLSPALLRTFCFGIFNPLLSLSRMRQLLQGAPAKVKATFGLTSGSAGDYPLTSCGGCTKVEGVDDGIEFNATVEAMKV